MSSTNKTAHLQLNQWVGTDPFRMADFNEDNQKLDAAITDLGNTVSALQSGALKIATGSYTGTGSCGQANPTSLTFDFEPKLVWIQHNYGRYRGLFFRNAAYGTGATVISPYGYTIAAAWSGNTLTWYDSASAASPLLQLNENRQNYVWFAVAW